MPLNLYCLEAASVVVVSLPILENIFGCRVVVVVVVGQDPVRCYSAHWRTCSLKPEFGQSDKSVFLFVSVDILGVID